MIKAIVFDMDGVLIDSFTAWFNRFNNTLKHFGFKQIGLNEFRNHIWAINFAETADKYFPGVKIDQIREYYLETFEMFVKDIRKIPNVESTLKSLKEKNLTLAVASNTQSNIVKKILERLNILQYFSVIIGGEMVKKGKPDPEILFVALNKLKMKPEEIFYVGDTIYDKQAAEKAKIKFIGYEIDGDERVDDLKELPEILS